MILLSDNEKTDQYNKPLYGLAGRYTLSSSVERLPYFMCAMPLDRAIDELSVMEHVSPSLDNNWSLSELFQRELDDARIEHDLVKGYLGDASKLVFFNALTVVLIPKGDNGTMLDQFAEATDPPPIPWSSSDQQDAQFAEFDSEAWNFGGVQYLEVGESARLRWSQKTVQAVAVDGQHRLMALRSFREAYRGAALSENEKLTTIPVLFVLLAPECGFDSDRGIRNISRELFTDLNKNAKTVDAARELILDDWSIGPRCVRTLVTDETARDSQDTLPLTLIRWQEANARFDSSYYLNSIVNLETLVSLVLALKPARDPMDKEEVTTFIDSVDDSLRNLKNESGRTLRQVYDDDYTEDGEAKAPFSRLPPTFLEAAVARFEQDHKPWLLALLTKHKPYLELLDYAREHNLIEGTFGKYQAQTKRHQNLIKQQMLNSDEEWFKREILDPITDMQALKGASADTAIWPYKSVFQKALVRLARSVVFEQGEDKKFGDIDRLIEVMDGLFDKGSLRVLVPLADGDGRLWDHIATNPGGGKIKVNKQTENRIVALLRLWFYQDLLLSEDGSADSGAILQILEKKGSQAQWPGCYMAVESLRDTFKVKTFLGKEPDELTPATVNGKVNARLRALLTAGRIRTLEDGEPNNETG